MAKVIITRADQGFAGNRRFRILIDGRAATSIAAGKAVEIDLEPGRHRSTAKLDLMQSYPVEIEARWGGVHHLRVGSNAMRRGGLVFAVFLPIIAPVIVLLGPLVDPHFNNPLEVGWFGLFLVPMVAIPPLLGVALTMLWREHFLYLEEIPDRDGADGSMPPPRDHPLRVRFTIRGLMIAVLILAIWFAVGIGGTRLTREAIFHRQASHHAALEEAYRQIERSCSAPGAAQAASRATAKADYHAAMKRKYEEAAARHAVSVAPDPPEPPRP